jgi:hypothetical protein
MGRNLHVEPILSAGAPTSMLIGAFSLTSAMKERAMDDPVGMVLSVSPTVSLSR